MLVLRTADTLIAVVVMAGLGLIAATVALAMLAVALRPNHSQPVPLGDALAGEGGHGSTIPSLGRVRSRNDMGV